MATLRTDRRPHLVPIWFVWFDDKIWISTLPNTVKVKNLRQNNHIAVSLEDGNKPIIFEGTASIHLDYRQVPKAMLAIFLKKYDWGIPTDTDAGYCIIEIQPDRVLSW